MLQGNTHWAGTIQETSIATQELGDLSLLTPSSRIAPGAHGSPFEAGWQDRNHCAVLPGIARHPARRSSHCCLLPMTHLVLCVQNPFPPLRRAPCLLESYSRWGAGLSQLPPFISTLEPRPFPGDLQCLISHWDRGGLCKSNLSWFVNLCQCSLSPPVQGKSEQRGDLGIGFVPPSPASHFDETILGWGWP